MPSKLKTPLIILTLTSILLSRIMFIFIDDPEGPNLLVVGVLSAVVVGFSYFMYTYIPIKNVILRTLLVIGAQLSLIFCLYTLAK